MINLCGPHGEQPGHLANATWVLSGYRMHILGPPKYQQATQLTVPTHRLTHNTQTDQLTIHSDRPASSMQTVWLTVGTDRPASSMHRQISSHQAQTDQLGVSHCIIIIIIIIIIMIIIIVNNNGWESHNA